MARNMTRWLAGLAVLASLGLVLPSMGAEKAAAPQDKSAADPAAQNFAVEHEIGRRFHIEPNDLPAPKTGPIVTNRVLIVPYSGQVPAVPPGFTATVFGERSRQSAPSPGAAQWRCSGGRA